MIDNAEYLNVNSSNALLKVLEEHNDNTFFFIILNDSNRILDTVKSRCIQFRFFFTLSEKKNILRNIIKGYKRNFNIDKINDNFYFDTPGNVLKYLMILGENNIDYTKDKLSCISYLIDKYKQEKRISNINIYFLDDRTFL